MLLEANRLGGKRIDEVGSEFMPPQCDFIGMNRVAASPLLKSSRF
jgi:hypothetical protein